MHSFEELAKLFSERFETKHFPEQPANLYGPAAYFLSLGGKRIRPVMCLMANELFDDIDGDAWHAATAIELFHNFTLIHDDIMDKASLRRGMQTVHEKYGSSSALLAGDVMLVTAYDCLNKIQSSCLRKIIYVFNKTAKEVCEGQQVDMDFEQKVSVSFAEYENMILLKTSVLLACSLQLGSIIGGAGDGNQHHLFEFGKNLGLAFQVQDDYLDAFGDPAKFGKQVGGDILANKKTFLLIKAMETASGAQAKAIKDLMCSGNTDKVAQMLSIFKSCGVDQWAMELKEKYTNEAFRHLEDIAVVSPRKKPLQELAGFLVKREY
ncbi:MAG: polyprenyl synthetase family protein [Bacteroidetes bacterium]|nr:polyprenyl synthetase family protein [Bacteroidota bacterium]MBS1973857.1 polyprenyl synthetase family protein [Bacteroidota bacterium]